MVSLPSPPAWLLACVVCVDLHGSYRSHVTAARQAAALAAQEELVRHLVADHLAQVPGYVTGCPSCDEWRAAAADVDDGAWIIAAADMRHRAAHLFVPTIVSRG